VKLQLDVIAGMLGRTALGLDVMLCEPSWICRHITGLPVPYWLESRSPPRRNG
jgi:hypothetical protein